MFGLVKESFQENFNLLRRDRNSNNSIPTLQNYFIPAVDLLHSHIIEPLHSRSRSSSFPHYIEPLHSRSRSSSFPHYIEPLHSRIKEPFHSRIKEPFHSRIRSSSFSHYMDPLHSRFKEPSLQSIEPHHFRTTKSQHSNTI